MNIRREIIAQFIQVAEEQGLQLETLTDNLPLLDSGLDSLCFAMIVARLEIQFGTDPFSTSEDIIFPVTFGEFVHLYRDAAT